MPYVQRIVAGSENGKQSHIEATEMFIRASVEHDVAQLDGDNFIAIDGKIVSNIDTLFG